MKKWSTSVTNVINVAYLSHLTSAWQIEQILERATDKKTGRLFEADVYDVNRTKECYKKLKDALPAKFVDLILDIRTILKVTTRGKPLPLLRC